MQGCKKRFSMKKVRFYLVFSLIIISLSAIGILLGMALLVIEEKYPEYLSAGIFKGMIIFFIALLITVFFHELAHAIAFKAQKIDIRMIYIFPICFVREKEGLKLHMSVNMQIGFGGIVIPQVPTISNLAEYESFRKKIGVSLVCAPLCSTFIGLISLLLALCTTKYIGNNFCSYYFLFFSAIFLWSVHINLTSLLNLGGLVGDYSAAKKIKDNNVYSLLQIYNFLLLQENEKKYEMREKQRYFMKQIYEAVNKSSVDKDDNSMNILLVNAVLYESLMRKNREKTDIINFDIEILKRNMHNILERLQFEAYFQTFSHGIIYMYFIGKSEEAIELWEKYKDKMPCTKVGKYNSKQVELFLYGKNIEELKLKENIKISSFDSLLSNINNYYDDEIYLNNLIIKRDV